jgi:hypothetical protein
MVKRFPSKVDWWLAVILIVCPFTVFVGDAVWWYEQRQASPDLSLHFLFFLATVVALTLLVVPVDYSFKPEELLIRSGRMKKRIRYGDIRRVARTHNPMSAPALSVRRLELTLAGGGSTLISPKDMDGFLAELKLRAPNADFPPAGPSRL